jgi:Trypsin-co-occurring domain 2
MGGGNVVTGRPRSATLFLSGEGGSGMTVENGEITAAIEQLRSELTAVQEGSEGARLRFVVAEVEMEFLVEATREAGGSGGVRLHLVTASADGRVSKGTSHHLRLKLDVRDTGSGDQATVSDRR